MTSNKQILQICVGILIIVILIVFATSASKAIKNLFGLSDQGSPAEDIPDTPLSPSAPAPIDFNPVPLASRLRQVHQQWLLDASPRCEAYEKLIELNINEFIILTNYYKQQYNDTLRSDMESTFQSGCSVFATNWYEKVINRMDQIGVNG